MADARRRGKKPRCRHCNRRPAGSAAHIAVTGFCSARCVEQATSRDETYK